MSLTPKITVYIASHNYGAYVTEAIESVFAQTICDWELLLINDGSTDDTEIIFEHYSHHPKVRIFHTPGIGLPSVNNLAIQEAKGKYIIRLDGDDYFDENILLVLANYLDMNENYALAFPDYYLMDESGEVFAHEQRRKLKTEDHVMDEAPNGACTLIRTDILNEVGCYRADLGAQDGLDLWLKIKDKYDYVNVNLPLFYYRRHGNNLTDNSLKIVNARRSLKKDAAKDFLLNSGPIIAVIPCRKHYDFVEDLWAQKIAGRSLLERDIEVCISSGVFDHIIVACDNEDAERVSKKYSDSRVGFFLRDPRKTSISVSIVETLKEIVSTYDPHLKGIVLVRYIQTPFVTRDTIEEAVSSLLLYRTDCAFSVEQIRHDIFERRTNGLVSVRQRMAGKFSTANLYRDAATCIAAKSSNISRGVLRGDNAVGFPVSSAESFFVRCHIDLKIASDLVLSQTD